MSKRIGCYPRVRAGAGSAAVASQAGAVLLVETIGKSGLDMALSAALAPWRRPRATHDPGKVVCDLAITVALGGDCLADVGMPRADAGVFGPVAGSNTAVDYIEASRLALAQLPPKHRRGRRTLVRTDTAGGTHAFLDWLTARGRWLSYPVGMTITEQIHAAVGQVPASAWTPAVEPDGQIRDGAWVAELAGDVLDGWPAGMRLIVRTERPHPGAQLRLTDADGMRLTAFATNTPGPIAALELRHRQRARAEDRIRAARDTGLTNLPLHEAAQNQIWLEIVSLALDLLAWMPMLALTGEPRRWEPKRLRLRLFSAAARLVTTARRTHLRFARDWPWTQLITDALSRLHTLPNPG